MVDALESHKQDIDSRMDAAMMMLEGKLTSGRPMSSFTAWCPMLSCLSRPADGDGVTEKGWSHGLVDALGSHEQGVARSTLK